MTNRARQRGRRKMTATTNTTPNATATNGRCALYGKSNHSAPHAHSAPNNKTTATTAEHTHATLLYNIPGRYFHVITDYSNKPIIPVNV